MDIFVAKYSPQGEVLWAVRAGSAGMDYGYALDADAEGNVYVTGCIDDDATFGKLILEVNGSNDVFVAKLDTQGNWLWVTGGGGSAGTYTIGQRILLGEDGALYTCGYYQGGITLGGHPLTPIGNTDIWAAKLDLMGNWLWAVQAGGTLQDHCPALAQAPDGTLVLGGAIKGNVNFGDSALPGNSVTNGFVAWLSADGAWIGAERLSSTSYSICNDVAVDSQGNVYVTGDFHYNLQIGNFALTGDWQDTFIAKIQGATPRWEWAQTAGGTSDDHGAALAITPNDEIYWTGYFLGTIQFGDFSLTYVSSADLFLVRLNPAGNYLMALRAGGICEDIAQDMVADSGGNVYLTGYYTGEMYFGDIYLPFTGPEKTFTAKLHETVATLEETVPAAIILLSNCPNPFSGETTLHYTLSEDVKNLVLEVYNSRGQKVKGWQPSCSKGAHTSTWDGQDDRGRDLPAGIYLCRMTTPDGTLTRKLALLK